MFNPFKLFLPKKMVGIDIGTSSLKIVELSKWGGGRTLENYGEIKSSSLYKNKETFRAFDGGSFLISEKFISRSIKAVLSESRIKTKAAIFSVPDYSTFCVSFEIPPMSAKEVPEAVRYHAPQYIPLPVSETTLDWRIVGGVPGDGKSNIKIFLVATPNQTVQSYQRIAKMSGLDLYALEAEALAITRSLAKNNKKTICLIDIGVQSTTINIVDRGDLKKSYSSGFAGGQLTHAISSVLGVGKTQSEDIKNQKGLISMDESVAKTLYLLIDPLLIEIRKITADFFKKENKEIEEIYLTGGTANMLGLKEYVKEYLGKEVIVPNCFSDFLYPPILEEALKEMAPSFSVAVGVAMGGLEE